MGIWLRDHFLKDIQEAFAQLCGSSPEISCSYARSAVSSPEQPIDHQAYTSLLSPLHPENNFSSFILDSKNRFAHTAAFSLAQNPSSADPCVLVIFSNFTSGKTHLLQAIGNYIMDNKPNASVGYLSSKQFVSKLEAVEDARYLKKLGESFLNLDILIMDDIHHLGGHRKSQQALLTITDALLSHEKPIILSSSKPPASIPDIDRHLACRLGSGILAEITGVEEQTRFGILRNRLTREVVNIPDDIIFYLINITEDVSELLRFADTILIPGIKNGTVDLSRIRRLLGSKKSTVITTDNILDSVARYYAIKRSELSSGSKRRRTCHCRHVAIYLCKEILGLSLQEIGSVLGKMNHSSVLYGLKKIEKDMNYNRQTFQEIRELKRIITYC